MTTSPDWRQFEELVARIEAIASPRAATVTSPDRVRDGVTGKMREVDASIRYRIGTVDILITIECRKRGRRADDTWIEQLATKRAKIGAAKTIAVSASGFSESAHRTAEQHGIELRTLSQVSASNLDDWFLPSGGVVHVFRKIEQIRCIVYLECSDGGPTDYGMEVKDEFEPIFFHDKIHSPFPAATLFHLIENIDPERFWVLPLDGTLTDMQFKVNGRGVLSVKGIANRLAVHYVVLSAKVGYEVANLSLKDGKHHKYLTPEGTEIKHTTFDAQLFGLPFEFEHQVGPEGISHAAFRVRKKTPSAGDA